MKKNYILLLMACCLLTGTLYAQQGSALNLDGVDDEVMCGTDASIAISGTALTLEARVKADTFASLSWQGSIINTESVGQNGFALRIGGNGVVSFLYGNGSGGAGWVELLSPDNSISINTWHHLAATFDGSTMRIYVDGTEVASQSSSFPIQASPSPLRLGESSFSGRHLDGTLDEVRIWNVVRTATEIMDNTDNELTLPQTGLAAYYKFNQGVANGDNTGVTALTDEMGANGGTLQNFTLNGGASNWVGDGLLSTLDFSLDANVAVYPNPVQNELNIQGLKQAVNYTVINLLGQEVKKGTVLTNSIDTSALVKGLYILSLEDLGAIKFVKE